MDQKEFQRYHAKLLSPRCVYHCIGSVQATLVVSHLKTRENATYLTLHIIMDHYLVLGATLAMGCFYHVLTASGINPIAAPAWEHGEEHTMSCLWPPLNGNSTSRGVWGTQPAEGSGI